MRGSDYKDREGLEVPATRGKGVDRDFRGLQREDRATEIGLRALAMRVGGYEGQGKLERNNIRVANWMEGGNVGARLCY